MRVRVPARARVRGSSLACAASSEGRASTATACPGAAPGRASTAWTTSPPPIRRRQSASTQRFQVRWAPRATWESSPPPTPPGPASAHTGLTRSGEARRTSTASAYQTLEALAVTRARTLSPGRQWRTRTTTPVGSSSLRATQKPPWAGAPGSSSSSSGGVPPPPRAWGRGARRGRADPGAAGGVGVMAAPREAGGPGGWRRRHGRRRRRPGCRCGSGRYGSGGPPPPGPAARARRPRPRRG